MPTTIEKISETEILITTPQPDKVEVKSKDKILEDIAWWTERKNEVQVKIDELNTLLAEPVVSTIKTVVEVQEIEAAKELPPVQEEIIK
jgi:cell fate (sporulation/competence/biofilm development) regulator YlbF (YheA/YmcA/DUF963 family)